MGNSFVLFDVSIVISRGQFHSSLFQALSQWGRSKKRFLDERDLVKKIGEGAETRACKNCFKNLIPVYQLPVYLLIGLF